MNEWSLPIQYLSSKIVFDSKKYNYTRPSLEVDWSKFPYENKWNNTAAKRGTYEKKVN